MTSHQFIQENKNKSTAEIALLLSKQPALEKEFIINQINGIQKAKKKLPEFYGNDQLVYPAVLSMEQCSSEQTAIFKSGLLEGDSLIDLTGGFGIDSYYFSKKVNQLTYMEPNKELFDLVSKNFSFLKATNIKLVNSFAEAFLKNSTQKFDIAYIDPSRRDETKRVFKLEDCSPNIVELTPYIFQIADQIIVKTAPFLDIKQSIDELQFVSRVIVLSVNNECKEVLYMMENRVTKNVPVSTINLTKVNQVFDFNWGDELTTNSQFSEPETYLYEPNTSILKAGAFNSVGIRYGLKKIAPNSHLYTSTDVCVNFPGRIFKIAGVFNYNPKEFRKSGIQQANVACRNFKGKPEDVKKKLKIKDGGDHYLFATTSLMNKPILINCVKY